MWNCSLSTPLWWTGQTATSSWRLDLIHHRLNVVSSETLPESLHHIPDSILTWDVLSSMSDSALQRIQPHTMPSNSFAASWCDYNYKLVQKEYSSACLILKVIKLLKMHTGFVVDSLCIETHKSRLDFKWGRTGCTIALKLMQGSQLSCALCKEAAQTLRPKSTVVWQAPVSKMTSSGQSSPSAHKEESVHGKMEERQ